MTSKKLEIIAEPGKTSFTSRRVVDALRDRVGADKVSAAATAFADSHPEPPGLFDLGDVSDAVAQQYGYGCALAASTPGGTGQ